MRIAAMAPAVLFTVAPAVLAAVAAAPLRAQQPAFEVVSVKINRSGFPGGMVNTRPGGQFIGTNETLRQLIREAYGVELFRILGGPDWIDSERFDVQARAAGDVTGPQMQLMLQSLLADRFRLVVRNDTRELPVYQLVVNRAASPAGRRAAAADACIDTGGRPVATPAGALRPCGALRAGPGSMSGRSITMDLLATQLSPRVDRVVANRTGLDGLFDIDLTWTPSEAQRAAVDALRPENGQTAVDPNVPGLFTAVEEQLGLRLQPAQGPVEVIVVGTAERPAAD